MPARDLNTYFGYTPAVLRNKPIRQPGQDIRELPTYTLPEAAYYLGIPRRTLFDWFTSENRILTPAFEKKIGDIVLLSFYDLAEAYVLTLLRKFYKLSMDKLRRLVSALESKTKGRFRRPLIEADIVTVLGCVVLVTKRSRRNVEHAVDLLKDAKQYVIPQIVDQLGMRIVRRKRVPCRIYPWRVASKDDKRTPVTIDPEVYSGRLVVTGTRIPVSILVGQQKRGKTPEEIAKSYRLSVDAVERAIEHVARPIHTKAA